MSIATHPPSPLWAQTLHPRTHAYTRTNSWLRFVRSRYPTLLSLEPPPSLSRSPPRPWTALLSPPVGGSLPPRRPIPHAGYNASLSCPPRRRVVAPSALGPVSRNGTRTARDPSLSPPPAVRAPPSGAILPHNHRSCVDCVCLPLFPSSRHTGLVPTVRAVLEHDGFPPPRDAPRA